MNANWLVAGRSLGVALLVAWAATGCDKDPSTQASQFPSFEVLGLDTIDVQEPLRIVFADSISATTALDPANFVVTDLCSGLRVSGALRLAGDTLVFSPSQALPFLTPIAIRVQNLLTPAGVQLSEPITFARITRAPPVQDVSWQLLNSPTNDNITGIAAASASLFYAVDNGGDVFRSTNGGRIFGALFKDTKITNLARIRAVTPDTLLVLGAIQLGSGVRRALFRSTDGGTTFDTVVTVSSSLNDLAVARTAGSLRAVFGGQFVGPSAFRYDFATGSFTTATGLNTSSNLFTGVSLSPDGSQAALTAAGFSANAGRGFAYLSADGGATYTPVTLPAGVFALQGSGFPSNSVALFVGDSSVVLRVDVGTGQVTKLGAADGIPLAVDDSVTHSFTTYSFNRVRFAPGSQIGWVSGTFRRQTSGRPDVVGGVLLMTRDGGATFTRQAVAGAPDNGLSFPQIIDLHAAAPDLAVAAGASGFMAARLSDIQTTTAACSFTSP